MYTLHLKHTQQHGHQTKHSDVYYLVTFILTRRGYVIVDNCCIGLFSIRNELFALYTFNTAEDKHPCLSFLGQVQKQQNYAELDHNAVCQVHEHGSFVTCKTTLRLHLLICLTVSLFRTVVSVGCSFQWSSLIPAKLKFLKLFTNFHHSSFLLGARKSYFILYACVCVFQPVLSDVLYLLTASLGFIIHYIIPQLRKETPWLCFSHPILKSREWDYFEVKGRLCACCSGKGLVNTFFPMKVKI